MKILSFILVAGLLVAAGCGAQRTLVLKPAETKLSRFAALEVPAFQSNVPNVPEEVTQGLAKKVIEMLKEEGLFPQVAITVASGPSAAKVLVFNGTVIQYEPGSRVTRWFWGGIGSAGEASLTVKAVLIDRETGQVIAEGHMQGTIASGWFGGSTTETHNKVAEEIVKFIKNYY